jgi:superfamily I DNA/RNA helicase
MTLMGQPAEPMEHQLFGLHRPLPPRYDALEIPGRAQVSYKVVHTKAFLNQLRSLQKDGHKRSVQAAKAAIAEAQLSGEISSIPRTKHGESRIPNVEKYDLPDAFRLVVQIVDGIAKTRAFLFIGSHEDAERWLDSHRDYRWVRSTTDGTLEFVLVTERTEQRHVPVDRINLGSSDDELDQPLLRVLSEDEWARLALPDATRDLAKQITGTTYEQDADGILGRLDALVGYEKASLLFDLMAQSHAREWSELHRRLDVLNGDAVVAVATEVASAMLAPENSESFISFDDETDLDAFFEHHSYSDWMLFLHAEQRKVADRDFRGPARLRGVSGSGKTSVLVHRARYLAKKYREPILLVTLAESMRKLLEQLADDLCGVERELISCMTMSGLAKQVMIEHHPRNSPYPNLAGPERQDRTLSTMAEHLRNNGFLAKSPLQSMSAPALHAFLRTEISYVRGRLRPSELGQYLDPQQFQRRGRGVPLNEFGRRAVLEGIRLSEADYRDSRLVDHDGVTALALDLLHAPDVAIPGHYRCVLCDEVQDLSQLELALLGRMRTPSGEILATVENGLFLAGDGAQSVYQKGFTLRRVGIDVSGRSFSLRKNYRNTYEILKAAFGLVSQYEFADVDEDNITKPSAPEFARRHGPRPMIVRAGSALEEITAVAKAVHSLVSMGHPPGQICIVGPNAWLRDTIHRALDDLDVRNAELRSDVDYESERVKISTIESAKGHEFGAVFIMGLIEGILPNEGVSEEEIPREAARFYVAMTRAREKLTITYSTSGGYRASRFLLAIQEDCDEAIFRDGTLRRIAP